MIARKYSLKRLLSSLVMPAKPGRAERLRLRSKQPESTRTLGATSLFRIYSTSIISRIEACKNIDTASKSPTKSTAAAHLAAITGAAGAFLKSGHYLLTFAYKLASLLIYGPDSIQFPTDSPGDTREPDPYRGPGSG